MTLKKTKPALMALAGLAVLAYHLLPWPRGGGFPDELIRYLLLTAYIGVDIFFFMAGYMAYFSKTHPYTAYIKRKWTRIYPPFLFFCLLALLMDKLDSGRFLRALVGLDFVDRGGGSFLWFLPALLLVYLILPLYIGLIRKRGKYPALLMAMASWSLVMVVLTRLFGDLRVNILLCRLPLIFIGGFLATFEGSWDKKKQVLMGLGLLLPGLWLTWTWGSFAKPDFPIKDVFYILAIPHTLGLVLLLDLAFRSKVPAPLAWVGGLTLELYAWQMVVGPDLVTFFTSWTGSGYLAFLLSSALIFALSWLSQWAQKRILSRP